MDAFPSAQLWQFNFEVQTWLGVDAHDAAALACRVLEYASDHEFGVSVDTRSYVVSTDDRRLAEFGQAQLVDWLLSQPAVAAIALGPVVHQGTPAWVDGEPVLAIRTTDPAVGHITVMYRSGELAWQEYLVALRTLAAPIAIH